MKVYLVTCLLRNSKMVAWVQQITARSQRSAIEQARKGSFLNGIASFHAVTKN